MDVDPNRLVLLASGLASLLLALLVLLQGPARGLHRAFAALLAARGITAVLPQVSTDAAWTRAALETQPYFVLACVPIGIYLLFALDVEPGRTRARLGWGTLAVLGLLEALYAFDHTLFQTVAAQETPLGYLRAGPGLAFTDFGFLAAIGSLWGPVLGLLGLRLALHYRQVARTPLARPWLLMTAGFLVGALFDGANRLATLVNLLDDPNVNAFPWEAWGWATVLLPPLSLIPAGLAVAVLAANRSVDPRPQAGLEGSILVLAAFATATGLLRLMLPGDSDVASHPLTLILMGVWRLALPVFVTAGLLDARPVGARAAKDRKGASA